VLFDKDREGSGDHGEPLLRRERGRVYEGDRARVYINGSEWDAVRTINSTSDSADRTGNLPTRLPATVAPR